MTKHLTLLVHRIFPIFLFIGLAWGQEDTDRLILRNGSKFSGKYLGTIFGGIKFETSDKSIVKPPVKSIQRLSINAFTIINNGQWVVPKEFVENSRENINQQNYDIYDITASNQKHLTKQVTELKVQKRRKTTIVFTCCIAVIAGTYFILVDFLNDAINV